MIERESVPLAHEVALKHAVGLKHARPLSRVIERESVPVAHDEVISIAQHEVHIRKLPLFVSRHLRRSKVHASLGRGIRQLIKSELLVAASKACQQQAPRHLPAS